MKRVFTAVALVPVVLLVLFKAPWPLFVVVIAAVVFLTLREYLNLTEASGIKPFRGTAYLSAMLVVAAFALFNFRWFSGWGSGAASALIALACLAHLLFGLPAVFRREMRMAAAASAMSAFGVLYIAVSLGLLIRLRHVPQSEYLIIFVLFSVWSGDIAAYYVGKNFGRRKLAPAVSPNKSWEGAIASVAASIGMALLVFHFRESINALFTPEPEPDHYAPASLGMLHVVALGLVTNIAAQFGDLFESALKRGAGAKDSGTLLPGHGGLLDRIDALLFAIPVVWYYAHLTGQFEVRAPDFLPHLIR